MKLVPLLPVVLLVLLVLEVRVKSDIMCLFLHILIFLHSVALRLRGCFSVRGNLSSSPQVLCVVVEEEEVE